jgi:ADP-heptose:LPS heptosyltransferase
VLLVGGPGERALADQIAARLSGPVVNLAEQTRLLELAALLEAADIVCSGDTGPMHLAAALGTPVVAVFTCTSPVRAGPYGTGHRVVATRVACAASYLKRCGSMMCMHELVPDRVWPALDAALRELVRTRPSQAG